MYREIPSSSIVKATNRGQGMNTGAGYIAQESKRTHIENLLMVEGAVPGPKDGLVLITRPKAPPRERRGFAGSGTVDPLKASKKASAKKK